MAQGVLIFFSLLLFFAFSVTLVVWIMNFKKAPRADFILLYLGFAGAIALFLIASRGLIKRKMYGKWLAVVSLVLFWGLIIKETLQGANFSFPKAEDFWQFLGDAILNISLHASFLWLVLTLALSRKVNRFFKQDTIVSKQT